MDIAAIYQMIHRSIDLKCLTKDVPKEYKETYDKIVNEFKKYNIDTDRIYFNKINFISPFCYFEDFIYIEVYPKFYEQTAKGILALKQKVAEMLRKKEFDTLFFIADKPIRLMMLNKYFFSIPEKMRYSLFNDIYTSMEYDFSKIDYKIIDYMTKTSNPQKKSDIEKVFGNKETITAYRGSTSKSVSVKKAYSWTTNKDTALFFAKRFKSSNSCVYSGTINKKDVISCINSRNEHEIIVIPGTIKDIKKMYADE